MATIRCKHGFRMIESGIIGQDGYDSQVVVLQCAGDTLPSFMSGTDEAIAAVSEAHKNKLQCQTMIPRKVYDDIIGNKCNFCHVILNDDKELKEYLESRSDMFRFVSHAKHEMPDGRIHLVH